MPSKPTAVAIVAVAFWIVFGLWAFTSPASFYSRIATYPPFNAHFLRDAGAFQLGLAAAIAAALQWRDALGAALAATAVAGGLHFAGHVIDRDLGGSLGELAALGVLAAAFIGGAVMQLRGPTR